MALARWEPFALDLPDRWKRLFDIEAGTDNWLRFEEIHEGGTLVVRAELTGVDPDRDVDVSVSDGVLHIAASRSEKSESKDAKSYRSEFRYGSFSRDLASPKGVESTAVKAEYKDGILEVRIPWPEKKASLPEKVAISRG